LPCDRFSISHDKPNPAITTCAAAILTGIGNDIRLRMNISVMRSGRSPLNISVSANNLSAASSSGIS
jgi:hypothetical protein